MSSEVYLTKTCSHCGSVERIHIGRFSAGWKFLWQGGWVGGVDVTTTEHSIRMIRAKLSEGTWVLENVGGLGETTLDELLLKIGSFQSGRDHNDAVCWRDELGYWLKDGG